jgi:hypothetical protein
VYTAVVMNGQPATPAVPNHVRHGYRRVADPKAQAQIDQALGLDTAVALNGLLEVSYARLAK